MIDGVLRYESDESRGGLDRASDLVLPPLADKQCFLIKPHWVACGRDIVKKVERLGRVRVNVAQEDL
jgi:hypothetical protein